jgi:hypothetical protein
MIDVGKKRDPKAVEDLAQRSKATANRPSDLSKKGSSQKE